ncbi:uncharacterized protein LOC143913199 [Arctopsyche grandis]|uniref:uncharacterized protein LOC143913199 n=1 Tax=Arctopsyche grandis TaxID=121162 RepID=UPI00406DA29C
MDQKTGWDEKSILQLIEIYKGIEILWNQKHSHYYNHMKKTEAWEYMGRVFGLESEEVRRKMDSLLSSFRREKKKCIKRSKDGTVDSSNSTWFAFKYMTFLLNKPPSKSSDGKNDFSELEPVIGDTDFLTSLEGSQVPEKNSKNNDEDLLHEVQKQTKRHNEKPTKLRGKRYKSNDASLLEIPAKQHKTTGIEDRIVEEEFIPSNSLISEQSVSNRDQFSVYGEHVANKLRNCGRSHLETAIAENEINNILFKLSMGLYTQQLEGTSLQDSQSRSVGIISPSKRRYCKSPMESSTLQSLNPSSTFINMDSEIHIDEDPIKSEPYQESDDDDDDEEN